MIPEPLSRARHALQSALRSLQPLAVAVALLYAGGAIHRAADLLTPASVGALLAAVGVKGVTCYATGKSVDLTEGKAVV